MVAERLAGKKLTTSTAQDFDFAVVSGDDGVVDGIEDVEATKMDTFLSPCTTPSNGWEQMECRWCWAAGSMTARR
jgi:hypothetical protein